MEAWKGRFVHGSMEGAICGLTVGQQPSAWEPSIAQSWHMPKVGTRGALGVGQRRQQSKGGLLMSHNFVSAHLVYTARVQCLAASANAYSAATVLPALVWAATNTERPCNRNRRHHTHSCWNTQVAVPGRAAGGQEASQRRPPSTRGSDGESASCGQPASR